jgi:hypothetical protein
LKSDVIVVGWERQRSRIFWVGRTKRAEQNILGLEARRGQSKIEERRRVQCRERKGEEYRGEEGREKNADQKGIENVLLVFYFSTVWPCLLCVGLIFHYVCFFFQFFSYSIWYFGVFFQIFFLLVWFVGANQECDLCREHRTFG